MNHNDDYRLFGAEMPERKPFFDRSYAVPLIASAFAVPIFIGTCRGVEHLKAHYAPPALEAPSIELRK